MNSVLRGTSYILVHAPDMVIHNGTTQTTESVVNPDSEYLKELPSHLRNYEQAMAYMPNQTYIGNIKPKELASVESPWYEKNMPGADRFGKYGEIMPQDEFILLMQICDVFDLVKLESSFVEKTRNIFAKHPLVTDEIMNRIKDGVATEEIKNFVNNEHAEPLYFSGDLVGYVKRAHDVDVNLNAHVIHENLVSKASSVLSLLHLIDKSKVEKGEIDYVIDCSEEACGDMNQRGGGNFAKAAAEIVGLVSATGSDCRGFCAAPTHAIIQAASLVKAGVFKNVIVCAGGSTAKLGMNGKDHVKKGMPILEDVIGGFAILVSVNDGVNPEIIIENVGKHTVGTGSSPQAVITSLVATPLSKAGMKITDVDKYSVEMQNPEVTKLAGAGDVPLANYKMIAALAVTLGDIDRAQIQEFVDKHGMIGWAPTQGHIPSGVPYLGFAREALNEGEISRVMIIGKGSLFLGRMTNLFDGVSFLLERNKGVAEVDSEISNEQIKKIVAETMRDFASSLLSD